MNGLFIATVIYTVALFGYVVYLDRRAHRKFQQRIRERQNRG